MSVKNFLIEDTFWKHALKLPKSIQQRIDVSFDQIRENPLVGRKLQGELSQFRKLRIGDYRLIYQFNSKTSTILIIKIEHRQGVYR